MTANDNAPIESHRLLQVVGPAIIFVGLGLMALWGGILGGDAAQSYDRRAWEMHVAGARMGFEAPARPDQVAENGGRE